MRSRRQSYILHGYTLILLPKHSHASPTGYVKRARLVLETKLGRYIDEGYVVHHLDGDKANDTPDNLVELRDLEHRRMHASRDAITKARDYHGRFAVT
ncbi:hypothetical protein LCGC14_1154850 [marine sediment metagenome]|uniref:HNH nuclease domain-containing protein n=1 Tax=marine sediment metagenome TaxID=412755 RepID=A0A0F9LUD1_9ZZZZ